MIERIQIGIAILMSIAALLHVYYTNMELAAFWALMAIVIYRSRDEGL